ncbi:3-methyladenine DNA glycosylase [Leucobacter triazinivorans]|uniref:3-methyladenine DNA glycosylase n=1 Tax=Leucobacter triazinivorans TaxID=1784719 RepID=UPI003B8307C8
MAHPRIPAPGAPAADPPAEALTAAEWRAREAAHERRADGLTAAHRARRRAGRAHPVEDFLWTYYSVKPNELRRWHPGAGVILRRGATSRASWRYYTAATSTGDALVDLAAFFAARGGTVDYVERLLAATLDRTPRYGCFGLHEWAMVYRMTPDQLRHTTLPLRIGHAATDRVVETHPIGCTHFDAFRFFTDEARPLNALQPTRETQPAMEQPGCLHAGMDVYKWAAKLGPIVPGELLLDCFELARDIREVDMQASPYDVSGYTGASGEPLIPIPIETAAGKREYVRRQRDFAERGNALRARVLAAISVARAARPTAAQKSVGAGSPGTAAIDDCDSPAPAATRSARSRPVHSRP